MRKREKVNYIEGSVLEKLDKMWEEQDRKARKEANRRFWEKVGIYGSATLAMIAGAMVFGKYVVDGLDGERKQEECLALSVASNARQRVTSVCS